MSTLSISDNFVQSIFARLREIEENPAQFELEGRHDRELDTFFNILDRFGPSSVSPLSSSNVTLNYLRGGAEWKLSFQGSGIGPVSSLNALINAIEKGLANGRIGTVSVLRNDTTLMQMTLGQEGYRLQSGKDYVDVTGTLPSSFDDITRLADLLSLTDVDDLAQMTGAQRARLFDDLADFGITGLEIGSGNTAFASFDITETRARLTVAGISVTAIGTFPTDFEALANALYLAATSDDALADPALRDVLGIDTLTVTGVDGKVLARIEIGDSEGWQEIRLGGKRLPVEDVIIDDGQVVGDDVAELILGGDEDDPTPYWMPDLPGVTVSDWLIGGGGNDHIHAYGGHDRLDGGEGHDRLVAGADDDWLLGGGGNDLLDGGSGSDWAAYLGSAKVKVSLAKSGAQATGQGNDTLRSIENLMGGSNNDQLTGNGRANHLDGGAGNDVLRGQAGADTLEGGAGKDRLIGGGGADVFVFSAQGATDRITDFVASQDRIMIEGFVGAISFGQVGGNQSLSFQGSTVILLGIEPGSIGLDDLIFG